MIELKVDLGARSYPILIGDGLLGTPDLLLPYVGAHQVAVITNTTVGPLFLDKLMASLGGVAADVIELQDGERFKTLDTYASVIDALMDKRHNRTTTLIALGGGVIGDLAGFAAATFQRGVAFVQVPTTLLAQVDASVGGKTGVNHPGGKNMIGAFHQPRCVLADTATLATLPGREYRAGLAVVVKYGIIWSADFFAELERGIDALNQRDTAVLADVVRQSCAIKAAVVAEDEREQGRRAILNYGHTFGHALETLTGYDQLLHGEAVAIGMVLAADCACRHGLLDEASVQRIRGLVGALGLPTEMPPAIDPSAALAAMGMDKKVVDGRLRLVLPERIGAVRVTDQVEQAAVLATLEAG
ncbi:MAG: 3-dehydroquinate synthase [Gammaproteobacteria bacterium]|nr:3-dehydroquinate synthase [Gammaproteobacteria bacterium]